MLRGKLLTSPRRTGISSFAALPCDRTPKKKNVTKRDDDGTPPSCAGNDEGYGAEGGRRGRGGGRGRGGMDSAAFGREDFADTTQGEGGGGADWQQFLNNYFDDKE